MQWRPRVYNPVTDDYFDFPKPVEQFQTERTWRYETHETPLREGKAHYDRKVNSVVLTIAGSVGKQVGDVLLSEDDMRSALNALYDFLKDPPVTGFVVYSYWDDAPSQDDYYGYQGCWPLSLSDEQGDIQHSLYTYNVSFSISNPTPVLDLVAPNPTPEDLGGL